LSATHGLIAERKGKPLIKTRILPGKPMRAGPRESRPDEKQWRNIGLIIEARPVVSRRSLKDDMKYGGIFGLFASQERA
jgi:hypothetical protein